MGAFLAYQASDRSPDGKASVARATGWLECGMGLPRVAAREGSTSVVKFGRTHAPASGLASADDDWLVSAGRWCHPGCAEPDDTQALLALLAREGPGVLAALDGCYAVAWYEAATDTLTVATDHLGRLHVYAAQTPSGVYVGTSATALARAAGGAPDPLAVYEFLTCGTLFEDRSLFAAVKRLEGTWRYEFRAGRLAARHRLHAVMPPASSAARTGGAGSAESFIDATGTVLRELLIGLNRPLPDLTGGLDSRIVVGLMQRGGLRFDTTVSGGNADPDVRVARQLAGKLGLPLLCEGTEERTAARRSLDHVLRAAARVDGEYDAIEYTATNHVHQAHAALYDCSVNGSGGEMLRNYWWNARNLADTSMDCAAEALRHFLYVSVTPTFLAADVRPEPDEHFTGVLGRALAERGADAPSEQLDHLYVQLRMQCWQGAIASATNRIWPNLSPLLTRASLERAFAIPARERLGDRLIFAVLASYGAPFSTTLLATGFPPAAPGPLNFWRFLPGLARLPASVWPRVMSRLGRPRQSPEGPGIVTALMNDGARDYLHPAAMQLSPLLDADAYRRFLDTAQASGQVSTSLLGRLISVEHALRGARSR